MSPRRDRGLVTRRRFLGGGAVAAGAAAALVAVDRAVRAPPPRPVGLGAQPPGLPDAQHSWDGTLARDRFANAIAARHDRLLLFDVVGRPGVAHMTVLEAALRSLERRFAWGPHGLLFALGWSPGYFARLGVDSPVPRARALSDFELPTIDTFDACLHLACNDDARLVAVQRALTQGDALPGADARLSLARVLRLREVRTGFTGAGLPAEHQNTGGIPGGHPVASGAPLFMGFKSSLRRNQASEDAVTIPAGRFAGGTTMHVSYMRLRLESWYRDLSPQGRVARMYAPQVTAKQVADFTTDAESDPAKLGQAMRRYGVIGHSQCSARARRAGRPIILRRDFNTVDGGQAGLHFVSLQRTIADFVTTRTAMNATSAQLENPAIGDTVNNGINEFIFVLNRANYVVPPRARRSFPEVPRA